MTKSFLTISLLLALSLNSCSQKEDLQTSDFFYPCFYPKGETFGYYPDADSLKNTQFEDFGENMWAFSQYLFDN